MEKHGRYRNDVFYYDLDNTNLIPRDLESFIINWKINSANNFF